MSEGNPCVRQGAEFSFFLSCKSVELVCDPKVCCAAMVDIGAAYMLGVPQKDHSCLNVQVHPLCWGDFQTRTMSCSCIIRPNALPGHCCVNLNVCCMMIDATTLPVLVSSDNIVDVLRAIEDHQEHTYGPSPTHLKLMQKCLCVATSRQQIKDWTVTADRQEWWKPARLSVPEARKHVMRKPVPQHSSRDNVYDSPATER